MGISAPYYSTDQGVGFRKIWRRSINLEAHTIGDGETEGCNQHRQKDPVAITGIEGRLTQSLWQRCIKDALSPEAKPGHGAAVGIEHC